MEYFLQETLMINLFLLDVVEYLLPDLECTWVELLQSFKSLWDNLLVVANP
jgi:hypothetical protein